MIPERMSWCSCNFKLIVARVHKYEAPFCPGDYVLHGGWPLLFVVPEWGLLYVTLPAP